MARKKFTDEQKAEVLKKAEPYLISGWNLKSIYRQLEAEYQSEGKELISWWSFYPLATQLRLELEAEGKISANRANLDGPDGQDGLDGQRGTLSGDPRGAEADADPEGTAGESSELDDYTARLEMIVRLYRTRSEAAVDAVCDRLLPELAEEE